MSWIAAVPTTHTFERAGTGLRRRRRCSSRRRPPSRRPAERRRRPSTFAVAVPPVEAAGTKLPSVIVPGAGEGVTLVIDMLVTVPSASVALTGRVAGVPCGGLQRRSARDIDCGIALRVRAEAIERVDARSRSTRRPERSRRREWCRQPRSSPCGEACCPPYSSTPVPHSAPGSKPTSADDVDDRAAHAALAQHDGVVAVEPPGGRSSGRPGPGSPHSPRAALTT